MEPEQIEGAQRNTHGQYTSREGGFTYPDVCQQQRLRATLPF